MKSPLVAFAFIAMSAVLAGCSKTAEEPKPAPAPAAEAAAVPAAPSNSQTFKIGELDAVALRDGGLELPNDNQVFGVGLKPEDVAAVLSANNLPTDKLQLSVQPLLVKSADRVLLFDTGAGTLFGPGTGKLGASLAEAGIDAQGVTDIFISHSHGDHIGGLVNADGALVYPNATIHLAKAEWTHLSGQAQMSALSAAMKPKVAAFEPGAELVPGVVKAVEIKGHTPGHSGYRITSHSESILYVGDSMHHYVVSVQKPEWTISFDGDNAAATTSRIALLNELAGSGQRVYAVHFPYPGIGRMEKRGETVVWVAE